MSPRITIVVLNGPLGIGKSTLAEAVAESVESSVMLDGDALIALNPEPEDSLQYLHSVIAILVAHHRRAGYRHFVINHIWRSPEELSQLKQSLPEEAAFHAFLLTLPAEQNLQRIARRATARALDERDFELRTNAEERDALARWPEDALGQRFPVDAAPNVLADRIIEQLRLPRS